MEQDEVRRLFLPSCNGARDEINLHETSRLPVAKGCHGGPSRRHHTESDEAMYISAGTAAYAA